MITLLYGEDDFSAHEALNTLKAKLAADGLLADGPVRVEGASARPDELLAACQTLPFLSERRLVIVQGLLGRFQARGRGRGRQASKRRGRASTPELGPWEAFVEGLGDLPDTTELIFIDGGVQPGNPLLQALRPLAQVQEFKSLKQNEVAAWIKQRAQHHQISIEPRAIAALATLVGNDLWTLDSELQKLDIAAGDNQITEADVRSMVSLAREPNIFAMADAVIEGRAHDAADLVQRLLADGVAPQRLLAMLARQYRLLLLTKDALQRGQRSAEISTRLRVQGFVMQRLLKQAPGYSIERLRRIYRRLLEADLSIKRGVFDDETAIELLLLELAWPSRKDLADPRRARPPGSRGPTPSGATPAQSARS